MGDNTLLSHSVELLSCLCRDRKKQINYSAEKYIPISIYKPGFSHPLTGAGPLELEKDSTDASVEIWKNHNLVL